MSGLGMYSCRSTAAAVVSLTVSSTASGQQDVVNAQGYDWIKIGDPGNPGYQSPTQSFVDGRGSVDYTYRMSKLEVSSGQWLEFIQFAAPIMGDSTFGSPDIWGHLNLIPLGAYPETLSPWGLLDMSGGGAEWTEELVFDASRLTSGSIGGRLSLLGHDNIERTGGAAPGDSFFSTIRLATSIPSPSAITVIELGFVATYRRRRDR